MTIAGEGRSRLQSLLLKLYTWLRGNALRRSRLGRALFEHAYVAYKFLLEAGPIDRLAARIQPGTWAIDVGANIGVFTVRFARRMHGDARVIAIEPESENFNALRRRIKTAGLESRVVLHCSAAAETSGTLLLQINPEHPGDHRLAATGAPVPAVTLDDLLGEHGDPTVSVVKIDVQGAEMRVLQGATKLLARSQPALFVEIDNAALRQQGSSAAELVQWLAQFGYTAYRLGLRGGTFPLEPGAELGNRGYFDALFLVNARRREQASAIESVQ